MNYEQAVADREQGQIPISISTSLALEGAFGIYPEREEKTAPILKYSHIWINVRTLFRNLMSVLPADVQAGVTDGILRDSLASEILTIEGYLQNNTGDKVIPVFYVTDTQGIEKMFPLANHKKPTTPKQKAFAALEIHTLNGLQELIGDTVIRQESIKIRGQGNALMLTHLPLDLLSQYQFDKLTLLESHTGKLKKRAEWGTKLGLKSDHMPLNAFTLQLFGDGGTMFSPYSIKYRRPIVKMMEAERWSGSTTMSRIRMSINTIKDPEIRKTLLDLLSHSTY